MFRARIRPWLAVAVAFAGLVSVGAAVAASGDLDPTFGSGGVVTTPIEQSAGAEAVALTGDGKIVAAGVAFNGNDNDFATARYNPDGSLDTSFGGTGTVSTDMSDIDQAFSAGVQSDNKVVVGGQTDLGFDPTLGSIVALALVRYNVDGSLDGTFGTGGVVKTRPDNSPDANVQALKIQPDGKILAAGFADMGTPSTPKLDFALVRYNANGSIDRTFGHAGTTITSIGAGNDQIDGIALQLDGKIVAAGITSTPQGENFAVARYTSNGHLDKSFGGRGFVVTAVGPYGSGAFAVALQADGKILAAGYSNSTQPFDGSVRDSAVVRYLPDGSLDTSFGDGTGSVTTPIDPSQRDQYFGVATDASGRILAGGIVGGGFDDRFTLARYTSAGALDSTFGSGGIVTTTIQSSSDATALVLQPDGRILLAGRSFNATTNKGSFALARYQP